MYCPNCGSKVDDDAIFCESCGTRLQDYEVPEQEMAEESAPDGEYDAQPVEDGALDDEKAGEKKPGFFHTTAGNITIGAAATVLVIAAIVGGVTFFNGRDSASTEGELLGTDADGVLYDEDAITDEQAEMLAPVAALMDQYSSQPVSETRTRTWNNSVDNWGPVIGTIVNKRYAYAGYNDYVRVYNDSTVVVSPTFLQEVVSALYVDYDGTTLMIPTEVDGDIITMDDEGNVVITINNPEESGQGSDEEREDAAKDATYYELNYWSDNGDGTDTLEVEEYDDAGSMVAIYRIEVAPNDYTEEQEDATFDYTILNIEQTGAAESAETAEYLIPEADSRYYSASELSGYDADQLRKARNEIYARHGRMFDSEDLQTYFNSKSWYNGTIRPDDFDESVLNAYEKANISTIKSLEESGGAGTGTGTPAGNTGTDTGTKANSNTGITAASGAGTKSVSSSDFETSWELIKSYDLSTDKFDSRDLSDSKYFDQYLSFTINDPNYIDGGDYYEVQAVFYKPILAPRNMKVGEEYTVTTNELTGETAVYVGGTDESGNFCLFEKGYEDNPYGIYGDFDGGSGMTQLEVDSADRLEAPFYNGVLRIRKDAVTGYYINKDVPYSQITTTDLVGSANADDYLWSNRTAFDANGYVTELIYWGD